MAVFVHAQGIKTVHAEGGGGKKWQNSVHVVVEAMVYSFLRFSEKTKTKFFPVFLKITQNFPSVSNKTFLINRF